MIESESIFVKKFENAEIARRHYLFTNNDLSGHPTVFDCYIDMYGKTPEDMDIEAEAEYKKKMGKEREADYIGISVVLEN